MGRRRGEKRTKTNRGQIDKAIAENKGILVHCARGRSRSATVIISMSPLPSSSFCLPLLHATYVYKGYLMARKKLSLRQAHTMVKRKRPIVGPHHYLQVRPSLPSSLYPLPRSLSSPLNMSPLSVSIYFIFL